MARIVELRLGGLAYRLIAETLDSEGLHPRRAARWSAMSVRNIAERDGPEYRRERDGWYIMNRLLAIALIAGLLAGCSALSSSSTTTTQSLAKGQAAVDNWTSRLQADQQNLTGAEGDQQGGPCSTGLYSSHLQCYTSAAGVEAQIAADEHQVSSDEFNLQVAQDQLKKDENG